MDQQANKIEYTAWIPGMHHKNDELMEEARKESYLSTDFRRPIGCVIAYNNWIIGRGSNQATITWRWLNTLHVKRCIRKMMGIKSHDWYWICPGCALFRNHAEARAVKSIRYPSYNLKHMKLEVYLYGHTYCCEKCVEDMLDINIKKIYINYDKI